MRKVLVGQSSLSFQVLPLRICLVAPTAQLAFSFVNFKCKNICSSIPMLMRFMRISRSAAPSRQLGVHERQGTAIRRRFKRALTDDYGRSSSELFNYYQKYIDAGFA